jgi:hypothetical protein
MGMQVITCKAYDIMQFEMMPHEHLLVAVLQRRPSQV